MRLERKSWRSLWPLLLGPSPPCPWSSDLHFHVNEPREESVSEFYGSFILFFSLKNWTRNPSPFSLLPLPGVLLVRITTNRALGPANSKWRTGPHCICGLMRSPEWKWEANVHWKYSVLSQVVPPLPLAISGSWVQCQQKVTCQADTLCNLGKGTRMGSESTLWTPFLSAQQLPKQGPKCGGKWKWERGSHDWAEWKIRGLGAGRQTWGGSLKIRY